MKYIIENIKSDVDKLSSKLTIYSANQIDFSIKTSVFIMVTLSISVFIIFVLFLKAKLMFRSYK